MWIVSLILFVPAIYLFYAIYKQSTYTQISRYDESAFERVKKLIKYFKGIGTFNDDNLGKIEDIIYPKELNFFQLIKSQNSQSETQVNKNKLLDYLFPCIVFYESCILIFPTAFWNYDGIGLIYGIPKTKADTYFSFFLDNLSNVHYILNQNQGESGYEFILNFKENMEYGRIYTSDLNVGNNIIEIFIKNNIIVTEDLG